MRLVFSVLAVAAVMSCHAAEAARIVKRNIIYDTVTEKNAKGVVETRNLLLDLYLPGGANAKPLPVVIFALEGCDNSKSKSNIPADIQAWADAGLAVASVDYRLAPTWLYPAGLTDMQQALRFLRKNAATYNLDPDRVAAHGESAGGYLAAMLGVQPSPDRQGRLDGYSARVGAVSDWSGRTDFDRPQPSGDDCAALWLGLARTSVNQPAFVAASVGPYVDKNSADFLIAHGTTDVQVEPYHSVSLAGLLRKVGRAPQLLVNTGEPHRFANRSLISGYSRQFLLERLGASAPLGEIGEPIRVNSGRMDDSDPAALAGGYVADRFFTSGQSMLNAKCSGSIVKGTTLPRLYEDVRYGDRFGYRVPVANGIQKLRLHFAECQVAKVGQRLMDVSVMGLPVLPAFDILGATGGKQKAATVPEVLAVVKSGYLDLNVTSRLPGVNAILGALEVARVK
jgi:acetyl esterase/lipase